MAATEWGHDKWTDGNFNGDAMVDGQDFVIWNGNKFKDSSTDPSGPNLLAGGSDALVSLGDLDRSPQRAGKRVFLEKTPRYSTNPNLNTAERAPQAIALRQMDFAGQPRHEATAAATIVRENSATEIRHVVPLHSLQLQDDDTWRGRRRTDDVKALMHGGSYEEATDAAFAQL